MNLHLPSLPYDMPLNSVQMSLIEQPYQESGIARGIAYLQDPTTRGVERLLSPNHAFQGSLTYQPTEAFYFRLKVMQAHLFVEKVRMVIDPHLRCLHLEE